MKIRFFLLIAFLISFVSVGQSIFNNAITAPNPSTSNPFIAGQVVNANITVSGIGRGSGISGVTALNRYNANGWSTGTIDLSDYFEFTLSPNSGFSINFTSFVYTALLSSGTASHAFRSSLDGFATNIGTPTTTGTTISLAAAAYQDISAPITFRFYAYGLSAGTTTFSINDFTFNGTVSSTSAAPIVFPASEIGTVGAVYNYFITTANAPTSFAQVSGTLPPGLSLNTTTGQISGSPTMAGTYSIGVTATNGIGTSPAETIDFVISAFVAGCYTVDFNSPLKNGYAADEIVLNGKNWLLAEALTSGTNLATDFGTSTYCLRMRSTKDASITLLQDKANGIGTVSFDYKGYGTFPGAVTGGYTNQVFNVQYSKDAGNSWITIGSVSPSTTTTNTFTTTLTQAGPVRFRIVFASGTENPNVRLNIDNLSICDYVTAKEIEVYGNSTTIRYNSVITSESNNTNFNPNFFIGDAPIEKTFVITNYGNGILNLSSLSLSTSPYFLITSPLSSTSLTSGQSATFKITFTGTNTGIHSATVTINNDDLGEPVFNFLINATVFNHIKCALLAPSIIAQNDFDSNVGYTFSPGPSGNTAVAGGINYGNSRTVRSNMFTGTNSFQSKTTLNQITFASINTLNYQNLEFNFSAGAYSTTSGSLGGLETKDYIEISFSIDGGVTYSKQVLITGNNNSIFDINNILSTNTSNYKPNSTTPTRYGTASNSTNTLSSKYKIKNLPAVADLIVQVAFKTDSSSEIWAFDNVTIKGQLPLSTTWNGTTWLSGAPTKSTKAIIDGNYNTLTNGDIQACECQVNSTRVLTIDSNPSTKTFVESQGKIDNNGTINVADGSSLVQVNDASINSGTGLYSITKKSTPYVQYDYTYWSSPIVGETVGSVFAANPSSRRYSFNTENFLDIFSYKAVSGDTGFPQLLGVPDSFDDSGDDWQVEAATNVVTPGRGYSVMGNTAAATTGQTVTYTESGLAGRINNGLVSVPVFKDLYNEGSMNVSTTANNAHKNGNLIGNPYASAIDLVELQKDNPILTGTFYFWTHKTPITVGSPGPWLYNFTNNDYVTYTVGTGGSASGCSGCPVPDQYVDSCQGFYANVNDNGNVVFDNSQRVTGSNNMFYRTSNSEDKIWLNLNVSNGEFRQVLIGFLDGAEDDYNPYYDGIRLENGSSNDFFTFIPSDAERRLAVQGLAAFDENKVVPLGIEITQAGTNSISINNVKGVFADGQSIYLQDNLTNTTHDFANGAYSFYSEVGSSITNRFVLKFVDSTLSNQTFDATSSVIVYSKDKQEVSIQSYHEKIESVSIFDILGREIVSKKVIKNNNFTFSNLNAINQALIVKVVLENGIIVTRKIII